MTTESMPRRVFIAGEPFRLVARGWADTKQCDEAACLASVVFVFRQARDARDLAQLADTIAMQIDAQEARAAGGALHLEPIDPAMIDRDTRITLQDLRNDFRGR